MAGKPARANGKKYTKREIDQRYAKRKKARLKAALDAERRARRIESASELSIQPLAIADIGETDLASETVDAVITDPPYAEADVPLYGDLASLAMRVLKPGGWCLAMVGDLYLLRIGDLMTRRGLIYRGVVTITFPGSHHSRIGTTKTFQGAKLILVTQKPPTQQPPYWGPNIIGAPKNGHDKSLHEWQQSQHVFERLIEHFTRAGDLIVDPFAGSGTTLRAALVLGRMAWGADLEVSIVGIADD